MVEAPAAIDFPSTWCREHPDKAPAEKRIWLWFNLLSLDAPLVAVVWQWFFARCYGVSLRWPGIVSLALSVWIIYVLDRLLDGRAATSPATARHAFARRHQRSLAIAVLAGMVVLLWASVHLARVVAFNGLGMTLGVVAYFLAVHVAPEPWRRLLPKELAVGVIFALGTSLVIWSRMIADRQSLVGPALLFAALCWLNCVAIEYWEWRRMGQAAAVRDIAPHQWTRWVGPRLPQAALVVAVAALLLMPSGAPKAVTFAALLSVLALLWLERRSAVLSLDALRIMADVALLSPAIMLMFHR